MFQLRSLPSPRLPFAAATMLAITMIGAGVAGWLRDPGDAAAPCAAPRAPRPAPEPPPPPARRAEPEFVVPDCPAHPYAWTAIQGQTQNAELVAFVTFESVSTESDGQGSVRIDEVLAGRRRRQGETIGIEYNGRWLRFAPGDRLLLIAEAGTDAGRWRPVFHDVLGLWKIDRDDRLVCPIGDRPDAGRPHVAEVEARVRAAARQRGQWSVRVSPRVRLSDHVARVTFIARNTGRVTLRVLPPTAYEDAIDSDAAPRVPFSELVPEAIDAPVAIPPGGSATFRYEILLADLGIRSPGVYTIGARLLGWSLNERAAAAPDQVWLGGMPAREMSLRVEGR